MLFEDNNDLDFTFLNLANITKPSESQDKFLTAKEGFLKGNMCKDEYEPYKNLTYTNIVPKTEKEAKLFNVMQYSFAINDLNLYLDIHPNDEDALKLLEELIIEYDKAKEEYVKVYGPLEINDTVGDKFKWIDNPWPWESLRGDIYV